jgi:hypothetical protein
MPIYSLDGLDRQAYVLGGNDVTIRLHTADTCPAEGQVEWLWNTAADEWGVTEDWQDVLTPYALMGPWFLEYDVIAYKGIIAYLQGRLDADYGEGTYSVDPFVLQACELWSPMQDDATYEALETCVAP